MAERRMFALNIIDSDAFICMPLVSQALYFHLGMRADDDGFVNSPKKILRMINAEEKDYDLLVKKRFLLEFDSGIIVIKHWRLHNKIRKDRCKKTLYTEEYELLQHKENGAYTMLVDNPQPKRAKRVHRLGKVRLVKVSLGKSNNTGDSGEPKPPKNDYKSVFEYYLSLELVKHRSYNDEMSKAMKKAIKALNCDTEHLKTLLDRHKKKVEISLETDYPVKVRSITEFFGQCKFKSTELICSEYDDPWIEPNRETFMDKKQDSKNEFQNFDQREHKNLNDRFGMKG